MIIATLEWNSDKGEPPIVVVADNEVSVRRAVVEAITPHLPTEDGAESDVNYIDSEWVSDHPLPALDDDAAVSEWLDAFKEETTDLWLNVYAGEGPGDTYIDARSLGERPRTSCGCGTQIVYTGEGWQHDAAPWFWGGDHDAHPNAAAIAAAAQYDATHPDDEEDDDA